LTPDLGATGKIMITTLQVLSESERDQVHEHTLALLAKTGLRVDTHTGRQLLSQAGAKIDEATRRVRFPRRLVEEALRIAPRQFSLGGRRSGWSFPMNAGRCLLTADGETVAIYEPGSVVRRQPTLEDWQTITTLLDAVDEIGVYWKTVDYNPSLPTSSPAALAGWLAYWRMIFQHFSKHVQESPQTPEQTHWMLEVLQIVFGSQETIRRLHPVSFLLCPLSPLVLEETFTEAYLATAGWDIPLAVMPMPLMGSTSPASLIATIVQGNAEVLAVLCLAQAAAPGAPVIYAPALSAIDPRSGRYTGGGIEHALLSAAAVEMGRYYGLPVQASTGGSDPWVPGIQTSYERALNWALPSLAWPDILVGPGALGGTTIFSFEQFLLDLEVFRRCQRLRQGVAAAAEKEPETLWLDYAYEAVAPGGNFLSLRATRRIMHSEEWYISHLGYHGTYEQWLAAGQPDILNETRQKIHQLLAQHRPMPLEENALKALAQLEARARG